MAKLQLKPNNIYPFGDFFQFLDSLTAKLLTLIAMMIIIQNIVSGGACAPPFCAVGRLSAPLNASSVSWNGLSIRRQEVFKGFGRRKPETFALSNIVRFPQDLHKNILSIVVITSKPSLFYPFLFPTEKFLVFIKKFSLILKTFIIFAKSFQYYQFIENRK